MGDYNEFIFLTLYLGLKQSFCLLVTLKKSWLLQGVGRQGQGFRGIGFMLT
jgi:hypothetical protein